MPRPVQVDRAEALRSARDLFWHQGYHSTSMSQLLDATNMGAGSFYAAFDNKARLFERVLESYAHGSDVLFTRIREEKRGLAVIQEFLTKTLVNLSDEERHLGCLLVNSALEMDGIESRLHAVVLNWVDAFRAIIKECVDEAIADGTMRSNISAGGATDLILNQIHGLRVESRLGLSKKAAQQRLDTLFQLVASADSREK